jgi:hypothetical protein
MLLPRASRPDGYRFSVTLAAVLVVCALDGSPATAERQVSEYAIKSAFLTRFLQFVEWAPPRPQGRTKGVVIAILGESPFCSQLPTALAKLPAEDGPVSFFQEAEPLKAQSADIVFVCESERARLGWLLRTLEESRTLTVAESSGFGANGVMLNLYVGSDRHVRFEANTTAASRAGIRMSSHLLRMARIVG